MARFEIVFFAGGVYLVHANCGEAYRIPEGVSLSTLIDWTIAHNCDAASVTSGPRVA